MAVPTVEAATDDREGTLEEGPVSATTAPVVVGETIVPAVLVDAAEMTVLDVPPMVVVQAGAVADVVMTAEVGPGAGRRVVATSSRRSGARILAR